MRSRTDTRRKAIIDHAARLFREEGYERTSMAQIAARVGGSKTTLYGYFSSKEELFTAVMTAALEAHGAALIAMLDPAIDDLRSALVTFGRAYLELTLSPDIVAITRTAVAESGNGSLGSRAYAIGPRHGWQQIAEQLQFRIEQGKLRLGDSATMARHLRGLVEAGMTEPCLYGAEPEIGRDEAVSSAIDAFLRAYGAEEAE